MTRLELPWPPYSGNNQYGARTRGRKFLKPEVEQYRHDVAMRVIIARSNGKIPNRNPLFPGECRAVFRWHPKTNREKQDYDNLSKPVCDALSHAGVVIDDWQITDARWIRMPKVKGGKVIVEIERLGE